MEKEKKGPGSCEIWDLLGRGLFCLGAMRDRKDRGV